MSVQIFFPVLAPTPGKPPVKLPTHQFSWEQKRFFYSLVINPHNSPEARLSTLQAILYDFNFPDYFNLILPLFEAEESGELNRALAVREHRAADINAAIWTIFRSRMQRLARRRQETLRIRGLLFRMRRRLEREVYAIRENGFWVKELHPELHEDDLTMMEFSQLEYTVVYRPVCPANPEEWIGLGPG